MGPRTLAAYLRRPGLLAHRVWRAIYDVRHPTHPWLSPDAIKFLESYLTPDTKLFEWGSGRSTIWFAERAGSVVSIEHDPKWHAVVMSRLQERSLDHAHCRLIRVPDDPDERDRQYWEDPPYVSVVDEFKDDSLDVILIDGLYRQACTLRAIPKLRDGGLLVIDNARQLPALADWQVPEQWPLVCWSRRRYLDTAIWRKSLD